MTIIESVRRWLATCPEIAGRKISVDFLPAEECTISIDGTVITPIIKRYLDGSTVRQFAFTIATRSYYGDMTSQQIDNLEFYEKFSAWLEAQSAADNLPYLGGDKIADRVEATSSGYLYDISSNAASARYQIQCRMIYDQD